MTTKICVFASSSPRTPERYLREASELGRLLAQRGWTCVNGAGRTGCMGALNDAVLAHGGRVEGVILRKFHEEDLGHAGLHGLAIADTMRERKRMLGDEVAAYLALPGGPGTWEELWEVAVERQIGHHRRPLLLINSVGFYDGFLTQLQRGHADGLLYGEPDELLAVADDAAQAVGMLADALLVPPFN